MSAKVCYFGLYDKTITRTRIIFKGLSAQGVEIVECQDDFPAVDIKINNKAKYLLYHFLMVFILSYKYLKLCFKFWSASKGCSFVIVGYPFKYDVIIAWFLCSISNKTLLVDYYMSAYETNVIDRKQMPRRSVRAMKLYILDFLTIYFSDLLIVDTSAHAEYFKELFRLTFDFMIVPIGAYSDIFQPRKGSKSKTLNILFWGNFIPLQGIEYIVNAAKLLEKEKGIFFKLIGDGQTLPNVKKLAADLNCNNLAFLGARSLGELPLEISNADICLGIFGDTVKAKVVVPNKAYEAIAMAKPLLTSDTPAIREVFTHKKDCYLCNVADAGSLADAIVYLKNHPELRKSIAEKGHELFKEKFTPEKIVMGLVEYLNK